MLVQWWPKDCKSNQPLSDLTQGPLDKIELLTILHTKNLRLDRQPKDLDRKANTAIIIKGI